LKQIAHLELSKVYKELAVDIVQKRWKKQE
jgi:hypothetical protein